MPARLPKGKEKKEGLTFSIEPSWKTRFMIACHDLSAMKNEEICASSVLRPVVIEKTLEFEDEIQTLKRRKGRK